MKTPLIAALLLAASWAQAAALPEASADFRRFTIRLRPGIFFADHPAFGGRPRELVELSRDVAPVALMRHPVIEAAEIAI